MPHKQTNNSSFWRILSLFGIFWGVLSTFVTFSTYALAAELSLPTLPSGLGGSLNTKMDSDAQENTDNSFSFEEFRSALPFEWNGFVEGRLGHRITTQPYEKPFSLGEMRLQNRIEKSWQKTTLRLSGDLLLDGIRTNKSVDLSNGYGVFDLREASILYRPLSNIDIKFGRQILTWGTGDLVFLNDNFAKDYNSFFVGRDEEYLKAPTDALKVSAFSKFANLDVIYTPIMSADRFANGERVSVFSPFSGDVTGRNASLFADKRVSAFSEDELAYRLYKNIQGLELALYGYHGFYKTPQGVDSSSARLYYPHLNVYGASARMAVFSGIGSVEVAYNDSAEDRDGTNPNIPNDQAKLLIGYERELVKELTLGVQYNAEKTLDYNNMRVNSPVGAPLVEEVRHLFTTRLTKTAMNQDLTLSLFVFYSPSDEDGYLRPKASYKVTDALGLDVGGNIFFGEKRSTFFGQLEDNSNIYAGLRYSF